MGSFFGGLQGGIISPILSNIYLDALDKFMEEYKTSFDKGIKRPNNIIYRKTKDEITKRRRWLKNGKIPIHVNGKRKSISLENDKRLEILKEIRNLGKHLLKIPYTDPMYPHYKRIQYVRYADDCAPRKWSA
ncbi:hypothetical protein ACJROX_27340 [Pseudalkalibacillus sp. A8]|uniref:hypothetical protein n=1 Tax=Pseudalkalibacillus sp. A8 TaxID=3382641 RepID=UPI0038B4561E